MKTSAHKLIPQKEAIAPDDSAAPVQYKGFDPIDFNLTGAGTPERRKRAAKAVKLAGQADRARAEAKMANSRRETASKQFEAEMAKESAEGLLEPNASRLF